jgi:hypothetical protein
MAHVVSCGVKLPSNIGCIMQAGDEDPARTIRDITPNRHAIRVFISAQSFSAGLTAAAFPPATETKSKTRRRSRNQSASKLD